MLAVREVKTPVYHQYPVGNKLYSAWLMSQPQMYKKICNDMGRWVES